MTLSNGAGTTGPRTGAHGRTIETHGHQSDDHRRPTAGADAGTIADTAAASALLLEPGSVAELRAIGRDGRIASGYFDDPALLAEKVDALDASGRVQRDLRHAQPREPGPAGPPGQPGQGVGSAAKDATTADGDILRRRWLPIDIDPVRPSGISGHGRRARGRVRNGPAAIRDAPREGGLASAARGRQRATARTSSTGSTCRTTGKHGPRQGPCSLRSTPGSRRARRRWTRPTTTPRGSGRSTARSLARATRSPIAPTGVRRSSPRRSPWRSSPPGSSGPAVAATPRRPARRRRHRSRRRGRPAGLARGPRYRRHVGEALAGRDALRARPVPVLRRPPRRRVRGPVQGRRNPRRLPPRLLRRRPAAVARAPRPLRARPAGHASGPAPAPRPNRTPPPWRQQVLEHGDPLAHLLEAFARDHVGDETLAHCLVMSLASPTVLNSHGLHVYVTGESGKGKSSGMTAMLRQVPEEFRLAERLSDKALYYSDDLLPGMVLLLDDITLSEELQEVLKEATSRFTERDPDADRRHGPEGPALFDPRTLCLVARERPHPLRRPGPQPDADLLGRRLDRSRTVRSSAPARRRGPAGPRGRERPVRPRGLPRYLAHRAGAGPGLRRGPVRAPDPDGVGQ